MQDKARSNNSRESTRITRGLMKLGGERIECIEFPAVASGAYPCVSAKFGYKVDSAR